MNAQSFLSAREKGDIYREKRSRYTVSAEVRGLSPENMFHLDTAHFVLEEYKTAAVKPLLSITGTEFADRPPTASGQRAFALSVAEMKKTLDALKEGEDPTVEVCSAFREPERFRKLLDQTVRSFFLACGMDEQDEKLKDHKGIREGRESFFRCRTAFEKLVSSETAFRKRKRMEDFRKEKGLEELPAADPVEEDPEVLRLCEEYPEACKQYPDKIRQIREARLESERKAQSIRAGRDALYAEGKKYFLDESKDWEDRCFFREAYLSWSLEAEEQLRELAYTRQAADRLLNWLLCEECVDEIIFEHIMKHFDLAPKLLDGEMLLKDLKGYVHPDEGLYYPLPAPGDMASVRERAREVFGYVEDHPDQFEAQSLLSIVSDTEGLCRCTEKAWSLVQWIDAYTITEAFRVLEGKHKIELFKICVEMDAVCHAGHTMMDFLLGYENRTIEEASECLRHTLNRISFSRLEKQSKEALGRIFMERSGFHVSQQKDRFLEYFGV